jgi:hypothetical protein
LDLEIKTHSLSELIWHDPCDSLIINLGLIIYSLDGEENLPKGFRLHNVELPFRSELGAVLDERGRNSIVRRQGCKHERHTQGVVNVPKRIDKCGISSDRVKKLAMPLKAASTHLSLMM